MDPAHPLDARTCTPEARRLRQVVVLGWRVGCKQPLHTFSLANLPHVPKSSILCPSVLSLRSSDPFPFLCFFPWLSSGKDARISATGTLSSNKTNINDFASFPALFCPCRIFFSPSPPRDTQCSCPFSPSFNTTPQYPPRRREESLPNLELIKYARDAAQNTIHPQGSLNACIHIQMASVHSEMERSELLINFEEHRNIWTGTSRSLSTEDPLAHTVVFHGPSSFSAPV